MTIVDVASLIWSAIGMIVLVLLLASSAKCGGVNVMIDGQRHVLVIGGEVK